MILLRRNFMIKYCIIICWMNVVNECSEWRIILYIWNKVVVKFIQMNVRKFVDEVCDELKLWWSCDEVVMKYLSLNCCDKALHHKLCESFVMKSWIVCCGRIVKVCDENVLKNCFIDCWNVCWNVCCDKAEMKVVKDVLKYVE